MLTLSTEGGIPRLWKLLLTTREGGRGKRRKIQVQMQAQKGDRRTQGYHSHHGIRSTTIRRRGWMIRRWWRLTLTSDRLRSHKRTARRASELLWIAGSTRLLLERRRAIHLTLSILGLSARGWKRVLERTIIQRHLASCSRRIVIDVKTWRSRSGSIPFGRVIDE